MIFGKCSSHRLGRNPPSPPSGAGGRKETLHLLCSTRAATRHRTERCQFCFKPNVWNIGEMNSPKPSIETGHQYIIHINPSSIDPSWTILIYQETPCLTSINALGFFTRIFFGPSKSNGTSTRGKRCWKPLPWNNWRLGHDSLRKIDSEKGGQKQRNMRIRKFEIQ